MARAVDEPLAGSAPQARLWVLLEQPGPWGKEAVTESHLDPTIGRALQTWALDHPVRLGLIRRPGRHADDGSKVHRRTVLLARSDPGESWLRREQITDPRSLLDVDLRALLSEPATSAAPRSPTLLVCTNAKRDRCCALLGRPLAAHLEATTKADIWETSHLGGHRFAPTLVSLPDGYLFGGPLAGTLSTTACRGRSTLVPEAQVAELAALRHLGLRQPRALEVLPGAGGQWRVQAPGQPPVVV